MTYRNVLTEITETYEDSGLFTLPEGLSSFEEEMTSRYADDYRRMEERGASPGEKKELLEVIANEVDSFEEL